MERKQKKRYRKFYRLDPIKILIFLILLILFISGVSFAFVKFLSKPSPFVKLEEGIRKLESDYSMIVMRNEKIIEVPDGNIVYFFSEGESVKKNELLMTVSIQDDKVSLDNGSQDDNTYYESHNQETEVSNAGDDSKENLSNKKISADLENIKYDLIGIREQIVLATNQKDFDKVRLLRSDYLTRLERLDKADIKLDNLKNNSYVYAGENIKNSDGILNILSPVAGMVSYRIDGYEEDLSISNLYRLNYSKIFSLTPKTSENGKIKIIDLSTYYLIAKIPFEELGRFKQVRSVSVTIGTEIIEGKVQDAISDGDTAIAIMQMREPFSNVNSTRSLSAKITLEDYRGLIIPNESIITRDGQVGVNQINTDGSKIFIPIKIVFHGDSDCIVEADSFYDSILGNVRTVSEGNLIERKPN